MKKNFLRIPLFCSVFLSFSLFVSACNRNSGQSSSSPQSQAPVEQNSQAEKGEISDNFYLMRIGHAQSESSPRHRSLIFFKEQVEKKSGGKSA